MHSHLNQLPRSITESSRNESNSAGHSHAIEKASVKQAGIVKLVDNLESKSKTEALTANQGRELAKRLSLLAQSNGSKEINHRLESALSYMATRYTAAYATYETAKANLCKHPENSLIYVVNDPTKENNGLWTVVGGKLVKAPWDALSSALTSEPFEVLQSIFQGAAGEQIEYEGKTYDTLATLTQTLVEGKVNIQDVLIDLARSNNFTASYLLTESGKFQEEVNRDVQVSLGDIYEHGAALPYDASMEYAEGAVVVKDGELRQWKGGEWVEVYARKASDIADASGKTQQEVNDRKLYFSDFIDSLNGSVFVDTQFIEAITAANGREIILQKNEIIRLSSKVTLGSLSVNIVGEGGSISIEHSEQGITTSGNVSFSGVIDIDCNKQSWCALDCTGAGSKVYIGNNVKIKNVYGVTSGMAVRTVAKANSIHASFDDISALANGIVGDANGVVRCIYLGGPKSKSIISGNFNNVYNVNGSGVRVDEDADAIQCQNGVHDILLHDADFRNIDKRWLKLQGREGSRTVVKNITGSSAFTGTPDNISDSENGLYACISLYSGTLEVDGVSYESGSCFAFLSVATNLATKVSLTNIQYHPEYHNYVQKLVTRFVMSEIGCNTLDLSMTPSVYATGVHLGVDLLSSTVAINVAGSTISSAGTAISSRAKNTTVHSAKLSKVGGTSGAGYGINIGADVEVANIFDNTISGDFQDGIIVPTRTTPLYGQITGNNAPNVTRRVLQLNDIVNTERLITFGNVGTGTIRTNLVSDTYAFKDSGGVVLASLGATGMTFNFESASATTLTNSTSSFNTSNKRAGRPVLNTTDNKLYLATGSAATDTWVSVDGATTISPV